MKFYQAVFSEKKLFRKYSQKRRVWGCLPFNIYPFWSELRLKKILFKIRTIYATKLRSLKKI